MHLLMTKTVFARTSAPRLTPLHQPGALFDHLERQDTDQPVDRRLGQHAALVKPKTVRLDQRVRGLEAELVQNGRPEQT